MTEIRLSPDQVPAWGAVMGPALAALITRSAAMGVLSGPPVTSLNASVVKRLLKALHKHGIGTQAGLVLAPLTSDISGTMSADQQRQVMNELVRLNHALEDSAAPEVEWPAMRVVFGDDVLTQLLGVAASSMRRYASGERPTPDETAARLHWLAMVVADLAGAYNDFGIRRWFERPRSPLGGNSPRRLLGKQWSPDGEAAARVRALASVLSGVQPLAA